MNLARPSLCALILSLSLALQPSESHASADRVEVSFPDFPVTVNGTVLDVRHSEYPLLVYKDITYVPMTWNNTTTLGLSAQWDPQLGVSLNKANSCMLLQQDLTSAINSNDETHTAELAPFAVKVNGQTIDNAAEPYPLLLFRNITYFPLTWRFAHDVFGWTTSWDAERGFGIESCGGAANAQTKQADALNVANNGQLAVQDGWIYMNPESKSFEPGLLVKRKMDGSEEVKLSDDNAAYLNIEGDWLYFTIPANNNPGGIYKMRTDGTGRAQLFAGPAEKLWVKDGWIYYMHDTDGGGYYWTDGIHRMKTDGTEDQVVLAKDQNSSFSGFYLDGDTIYYVRQNNLFRMNLDGTDNRKLREDVTHAVVIDGWIYYVSQNGMQLNKMSGDGAVDIPLYTSKSGIITLQYSQGWIYMAGGHFGIMGSGTIDKLRIDGTGETGLMSARATSLYFAGGTLYYNRMWEGSSRLDHMEGPARQQGQDAKASDSASGLLTDSEVKDILSGLIPKAVSIYGMFNGAGWFKVDKTKTIPGEPEYCLVTGEAWKTDIDTDNVKSIADLKKVIEDVFTNDIAEKVFYSRYLTPEKDRPLYKDYEGKLFEDTMHGGHGWATKFLIDTAKLKEQHDHVAVIELDTTVLDDPADKITLTINDGNGKWRLASRLD
jgi:hypothetical protein